MVESFFRNLQSDEMLNFSVAVTVMRVQRQWRARMRAAKLRRKKDWRHDRADAPHYTRLHTEKEVFMSAYAGMKAVSARKAWHGGCKHVFRGAGAECTS